MSIQIKPDKPDFHAEAEKALRTLIMGEVKPIYVAFLETVLEHTWERGARYGIWECQWATELATNQNLPRA